MLQVKQIYINYFGLLSNASSNIVRGIGDKRSTPELAGTAHGGVVPITLTGIEKGVNPEESISTVTVSAVIAKTFPYILLI